MEIDVNCIKTEEDTYIPTDIKIEEIYIPTDIKTEEIYIPTDIKTEEIYIPTDIKTEEEIHISTDIKTEEEIITPIEIETEEETITRTEIEKPETSANNDLLPKKSKDRYNLAYTKFVEWQTARGIDNVSEHEMLAYFEELAQSMQASTLWSLFSMLKSTLNLKRNIDIGKYNLLTAYLKRKSEGFRSKETKTLSSQDVKRFLKDAPDIEYLATKVALIFGVCGACRGCELTNLVTSDIRDRDDIFLVQIKVTKNTKPRFFVIEGDFYHIVKKYVSLRPRKAGTNRFFLNYQHGKCTRQAIGKNKFASMPKQIARYLNLDDADLYTGRSFRRTSAALLANSGANLTMIKKHGGWRSDPVGEGYIEELVDNKREIGQMITSEIHLKSEESDED